MKPHPNPDALPARDHPHCMAMRDLLQKISSKWTTLIVTHLEPGPKRFTELKRGIGITQKSLTASLRDLERDGLVERVVTPTIPPRVDYALTPLGRTLLEPLRVLTAWAVEKAPEVATARAHYAARTAPKAASRGDT
ncbi:winged helix-turn-helix transcriptional regulator [Pseudodonghicola flavimaris]|uniref:Helix-turn-helix domain-containing protein n=1 Tax=Pseudodonghicola flavimaris TaxID=3050036 RepID=A0ABT7F7S3_9RHOB|nr:helix-turn-helix domain-containing protein [Pseudodonghicola flavimaris]MDK3020664.1 helix-turn-helix domain-containing protein [Pseudodonghicola flavimaris]